MNKNVLYFTLGAGISGAISSILTYFVTKNSIEKRCDAEIDEMREYYTNIGKVLRDDEIAYEHVTTEVPKDVKEALERNWNKPPLKSTLEELAESEHPMDSDEDEDIDPEEDELIEKAANINDWYTEHKNDPPMFVNEDDEIPVSVEERDWTYYDVDGVMTDDDNQIVEDFRRFVGDLLDESGWITDQEADDVKILSAEYSCLYYISKINKAFADTDYARQQVYAELADAYRE